VGRALRFFRVSLRARFRGLEAREGALLQGPSGWGEFSPFSDYTPARAARWLAAAQEAAFGSWPSPLRNLVPVNVTVPTVAPERAHALVAGSGCDTAKVKVGTRDDEARVEAVRAALGPRGRIRIDANGSWDVATAARRIRALARYGLEYAEQPVATLEEMAELRRRVDVPLAVDESLRTAPDPERLDVSEAADLVVLKVAPLGGVRAALRVADACGLPAVVSSALETSVGLAAGVALAAALPELPFACGLGTATLLAADVCDDPLVPVAGALAPRRPAVGPGRLAEVEIDEARAARVVQLLRAARRYLPAAEST
jgi:o-succinylbenzoate synthase